MLVVGVLDINSKVTTCILFSKCLVASSIVLANSMRAVSTLIVLKSCCLLFGFSSELV
jgi:hypothetical protein